MKKLWFKHNIQAFIFKIIPLTSISIMTHAVTQPPKAITNPHNIATDTSKSTNNSPTLLQLQQDAINHDPDLKSRLANVDIANADITLAQTRWYPSITGNINRSFGKGYGKYDNTNITDPRTNETGHGGIALTQNLYDPTINLDIKQAKLTATSNNLAVTQGADELTDRIVGLFFDILADQAQIDLYNSQLDAVTEQQKQAQKSFEIGTVSITDVKEAEAKHDKLIAQKNALQWELASKQQELSTLTGGTFINPADYRSSTKILPEVNQSELTDYLKRIDLDNPQLQQAKLDYQISQINTKKQQYRHYPKVQMTLDVYHNFEPFTDSGLRPYDKNKWEWNAGIQANFNLFTTDSNTAQKTKALAEQTLKQRSLQALYEKNSIDLEKTLYQILASNAQYQGLHTADQSARTALDANRLGYQVGMRVNADVLEAQSKVYEVKHDKLVAWYDSWKNYIKLNQLSGSLLPSQLAEIDSLLRQNIPDESESTVPAPISTKLSETTQPKHTTTPATPKPMSKP